MHNPNKSGATCIEALSTLPFLGPTPTHASLGGSSVDTKAPGSHSLEPTRTDDI